MASALCGALHNRPTTASCERECWANLFFGCRQNVFCRTKKLGGYEGKSHVALTCGLLQKPSITWCARECRPSLHLHVADSLRGCLMDLSSDRILIKNANFTGLLSGARDAKLEHHTVETDDN